MVSSPLSLFRPRRSRPPKEKISWPPSSSPPVVLIEEVPTPSSSDSTEPTEEQEQVQLEPEMSPTVADVVDVPVGEEPKTANGVVDNGEMGNGKRVTVIEEEEEEPVQAGCTATFQHGLEKVKHAVEEIPPEYKEAARFSGLISASLTGLFISIVLYRCVLHFLYPQQQTLFCSYFSRPFAPLFDALCQTDRPGIATEFAEETQHLVHEVQSVIFNFFTSIFAGFRAFGTIFWALFGGILEVITSGIHELVENVTENVAFLLKFCCDFVNSILYIFYKMVTGTIDQLGIAVSSLSSALRGQRGSSSWL